MHKDKMLKITRKVSNSNIDSRKVNELVDYAKDLNVRIVEFDKKQRGLPCAIGRVGITENQVVAGLGKINDPKIKAGLEVHLDESCVSPVSAGKRELVTVMAALKN